MIPPEVMLTVMLPPEVLSHIISQLRPGADLSKVVLPTFILEPRSMLERITKYDALSLCGIGSITNVSQFHGASRNPPPNARY